MKITFLTSNQNKLREAQEILGADFEVAQQKIELDEIQSNSSEEVIKHKITEAQSKLAGELFFIEDTCLYLGADREVGPLIKFFPNHRVVKAYLGEPAQAVCTIGLSNGEIFAGVIDGQIVESRGETKFQWDPIFQPNGYDRTFAEMPAEEKNLISMRRLALEKLRDYLKQM